VKQAALDLGLPVTDRIDDLLGVDADLGVVVAFGRLLRRPLLDLLPLVNLHFSLLPRWRGAAPVERAILAGDRETGVALMAVDEGLDTGAVYDTATVEIGRDETLDELRGRLVDAGTGLLLRALREGFPSPVPQQGEPTYAEKLTGDELRIDWRRPADEVLRLIRLGSAWTTFRDKRLKVARARAVAPPGDALPPGELSGTLVGTGTDPIELLDVQAEGRAAQSAAAWSNGAHLGPGDRLGP
jgi:methionyl-tRNA formyltransferase